MELARDLPGYNGRIPKEAATLPAVLGTQGYSTMALGKWHLTPVEDITPIGPFDLWPLGQGFGRFYGFLGGSDQYRPELTQDNHFLAGRGQARRALPPERGPRRPRRQLGREHRAVAPGRPFFCYLAFGAMHQPHQVWPEWSDRYRGAFADGWDVVRRQSLAAQKTLGVVPGKTVLPPPNPGVPAWSGLTAPQRQLCERQMELYAASCHTPITRWVALWRRWAGKEPSPTPS